ncbi:tetratricopeptide repeat protein [Methylomagnum sp.]
MRRALLLLPLFSALAVAEPEMHDHHHHHHEAAAAAPTVDPAIFKEFQAIEALAAKSAYGEAEAKIQALLPQLKDNPAAEALLRRNLATLHGMQKHYVQAAQALEQALALRALPAADATQAQLELAQYHLATENYPKAADTLSVWIEQAANPTPEHFLLLADIRTRLKQYPEAAALIEQAIARAPQPKPEWYQRLLGLHHESHNHQGCAKALAALIDRFPDNALYWNQLTGIYQEMGDEPKALAVRQLMYQRGMLKSSAEIVQLAQVLRYRGLSGRAAELLQREIERGGVEGSVKHLELLADAWTEAKDLGKAAVALERATAQTDVADTRHRLGQIYSELHDWSKARQSLDRALAQGNLKNPGGAWLLLGLAHYRLNDKEQARDAFTKAQTAPAVRQTARQWLEHMDKEAGQRHS